jgi:hypothetical protein
MYTYVTEAAREMRHFPKDCLTHILYDASPVPTRLNPVDNPILVDSVIVSVSVSISVDIFVFLIRPPRHIAFMSKQRGWGGVVSVGQTPTVAPVNDPCGFTPRRGILCTAFHRFRLCDITVVYTYTYQPPATRFRAKRDLSIDVRSE